jgi:hypothetical protein
MQFKDAAARVRENSRALQRQVQDPRALQLLTEFIFRHEALGAKYQEAYDTYLGTGFDFKAADKIVRGMDRPATDLFDHVVARLTSQADQSVARQRSAAAHNQLLARGIAGACLLAAARVDRTARPS